jgi:hypothetical protein
MSNRMLAHAFLAASALLGAARAEFPIGSMAPNRLGIQYGFAFRGQNITSRDVPSHEVIHALDLGYAPIPFLELEAGLGVDRLSVDRYDGMRFRGDYGLSPLFGATAASPLLFDLLRFTGGSRVLYLNSEDDRGYAYSGFVYSPFLSAIVSPSEYVDLEAGARGHRLDATMEGPGGRTQAFSNREMVRGFVAVTLKSPSEFAFFTLDADFSPSVDSDWSGGPREASIGVSFGTLLGWKPKPAETQSAPPFFPAYPEMKERQKKMAEELQ